MPEQSHPPYLPAAMYQPRQILRWLDINYQNGPLSRTQTYITLPSFSFAVTWKGYSEIVAAYNFKGPNGFSLKSLLSNIPIDPNYLLAISWYDSLGNFHRYALWSAVGEVIYFALPLYTGQLIKKNFRLEVWSTNVTNVINAAAINIYTSVLGGVDYRYGLDGPLVNNDLVVTSFGCPDVVTPPPTDYEPTATDWWKPSGIVSETVWNTSAGTGSYSVNSGTPVVQVVNPNATSLNIHQSVIQFTLSSAVTLANLYLVIVPGTSNTNGIYLQDDSDTNQFIISWTGGGSGLEITMENNIGATATVNCPLDTEICGLFLGISAGVMQLFVYNSQNNEIGTETLLTNGWSTLGSIILANIQNVLEVVQANATYRFEQHIFATYGFGWSFPITFPAGAISITN